MKMVQSTIVLLATIFLITSSTAVIFAFETSSSYRWSTLQAASYHRPLSATNGDSIDSVNDGSIIPTTDTDDTTFSAYSGLSNAWGYSRSVVNSRQRRRYERRRAQHRWRLEGKPGTMRSSETTSTTASTTETTFDDMDEDGYYGVMGGKRIGFLSGLLKNIIQAPIRALPSEYGTVTPGTLILVRHGESVWNANKTFTGWADPDLSPQGYREVEHAARLLVEGGYGVDIVFTSRLKRAIRSSWILLRELNEVHLPVFKSWRLNERMYGALTGLSKAETAERLGVDLVQEWRGSLLSRPPALSPGDFYYPGRDRRHSDLSPSQIPLTESLLDCMERTKPVWLDKISYEIACGRNVLVVAHANTLRGLVKIIDNIGDDEIQDIAIPTGIPIIYNFDKDLNPIPPSGDQRTVSQVHMKGVFLEKPGLLKQAIRMEKEWSAKVPDYDYKMSRSIYGAKTPLQRSLSKLVAEREVQTWAATQYTKDEEEEEDDGSDGKLTLVEQVEEEVKECSIEGGGGFDPDCASFMEEESGSIDASSDEGLWSRGTTTTTSWGQSDAASIVAPIFNTCVTALPVGQVVPGIGPVPVQKKSSLIVMIRHGKTENNKLGLFTGWDDVPLATDGVEEAKAAGKLLKRHGFEFDAVYTSWLSRAIETAWYVMDEMDCLWLPIIKSWRLNERMYGSLTGMSKAMVKQRHGEKQFMSWRRGYAVRPPPVSSFSPQYPGNDVRYNKYLKDVRISLSETFIRSFESRKFSLHRKLPKSESLKDCMERTIPYFTEQIMPEAVEKGKRVLIASSENAIRGLLMHLCEIPEEKIAGLEIPNGLPLIYDMNSKCIKLLDDGSGQDPLEKYNFGTSASYLFRPCKNPDGTDDDGCSLTFRADIDFSPSDSSIIESIRKSVKVRDLIPER